jgi:hypothetical protein
MADLHTGHERFDRFLGELLATATDDPNIVGIVGMGSTGARHRVDEWSDHDVAVVTTAATCERFRTDLESWLPDAASIAMSAREHHDGIVVVLDDGHVVELGVTSLDDLAQWYADPDAVDVLYDAGGVAAVMATVAAKPSPTGTPDDARDIRVALARLLIGVGRARRGEALSAGQLIRGEATGLLLAVITRRVPAAGQPTPDPFDPRRRFEAAYREIGAQVAAALEQSPEDCARLLLEIAEEHLAPGWDAFPRRGARALRIRLGWT